MTLLQPVVHGRHRGLWIEEAFGVAGEQTSPPSQNLTEQLKADVCVIGGGYTGLWTALRLKELEPTLDVVVLEADHCGSGASGRNGGFVLSWWSKLRTLIKLCGEEEGLRLARAAEAAVPAIGRFCEKNGIDAHFSAGGWLWAATSSLHLGAWDATVSACEERGLDVFTRLAPAEVTARAGSPIHLGGVWERAAATVQPALLAGGLRRVAAARGIRIFENTPVASLTRYGSVLATTPAGSVTASAVVLAINAWAASLPELRRAILPMSSDVIATVPNPDHLPEIGWTGGESISDTRMMVHYYRTTRNGRIVFGRGGEAHGFLGRVPRSLEVVGERASRTERGFHRAYPMLTEVAVSHAWTGAVDRSEAGLPFFGELREVPGVHYGVGFSGNGVGPAWLAGRILASRALGRRDVWTEHRLNHGPCSTFSPDPVRYFGGILVREAIRREERAADLGRPVGDIARAFINLAPAGVRKGAAPAEKPE